MLNTPMETKHRLLLLLATVPVGEYAQLWISAIDFMSIYGVTFGVADQNLHGDSWMRFTEYATRFWSIRAALHELVLNGWAAATPTHKGFSYRITEAGMAIAREFSTSYVPLYRQNVTACYERYGRQSGEELDALIRSAALNSMEQEDVHG